MHCWKILNIRHQYGNTRIFLYAALTFVLTFSLAFIGFNYNHHITFTDDYFWVFALALFLLYPAHKCVHYLTLYRYKEFLSWEFKRLGRFVPIIHIRINEIVPKSQYIITRSMPFIVINTLIIILILAFPNYLHYGTLLLAYHTSMCVLDILYVKNLVASPRQAQIEETSRGYEILVPPNIR